MSIRARKQRHVAKVDLGSRIRQRLSRIDRRDAVTLDDDDRR